MTVLPENITTVRALSLQHHQNSFSIEFVGLNFNFIQPNCLLYQLEKLLIKIGTVCRKPPACLVHEPSAQARTAYSVRASDSKDHWPSSYRELQLRIVPAWWQTIVGSKRAFIKSVSCYSCDRRAQDPHPVPSGAERKAGRAGERSGHKIKCSQYAVEQPGSRRSIPSTPC